MKTLIYHGSEGIVIPKYGIGKPYNDYGQGFYCTESLDLAKEWACSRGRDGYANAYEISLDGLSVLNLNESRYNILNWLAILLDNRKFASKGPLAESAKAYILENFLPAYRDYDVIKGCRADGSYFSFAGDFVSNSLSLGGLKEAMSLGALGEQIVLKSREAFDRVVPLSVLPSYSQEYFAKYAARDIAARQKYRQLSQHPFSPDELYILEIIRNNIKNGDTRL